MIERLINKKDGMVIMLSILVLISMPINLRLNTFVMLFFLCYGLFNVIKNKVIYTKEGFIQLSFIFFLIHVAHGFFSDNVDVGWYEVEKKVAFAFLPLLWLNLPIRECKRYKKVVLKYFSYGMTLLGIFLLVNASIKYSSTKDVSVFYYHEFSGILQVNAIYMSLLFSLSLSVLLEYLKDGKFILNMLLILFTGAMIVLLSSKMIIAISVLVFLFYMVKYLWQERDVKVKIGLVISLLALVVAFFNQSRVTDRFEEVDINKAIQINEKEINQGTTFNGADLRLRLWDMGREISVSNKKVFLFGVGPGDAQALLDDKIIGHDLYTGNDERNDHGFLGYNFHNQYMQTLVETGFVGLIVLLTLLIYLFYFSVSNKNQLLFVVNLIFVVAFLSESYLSRQIGIISFLTFNAVLLASHKGNRKSVRIDYSRKLLLKRAFDVFFAAVVCVFFLSWFLPLISIFVFIDTKTYPIFLQKRVGKDGRIFYCYKLRTMKQNEDADKIPAQINDTRITKLGHILRKFSVDEFPQFYNVLRGDMSIVGPRPLMVNDEKKFSQVVPNFTTRLYVKPGITGLAQSKGFKGMVTQDWDVKMRYILDRFYAKNHTFKFDVIIILNTIIDILSPKNTN